MKLGYSTWGMPTIEPEVAIPYLADLGFDGVEICVVPGYSTDLVTLTPQRRSSILDLLSEHDLELPAISGNTSLMAADPSAHQANMARLFATIDLAVDWAQQGAPPCITTTAGGRPDDWERLRPQLIERSIQLANYAARAGVIIAIEPHVGSIMETPQQILSLVNTIDSPYLRVNFDISHFNVMGIAVEESVAALAAHAAHTHVKDERGLYPNHEFLIPGEGEFDYTDYLRAMQRHGYEGTISAEISVMVQRRPDYDPLATAAQTYTVLARAFEQAGIKR